MESSTFPTSSPTASGAMPLRVCVQPVSGEDSYPSPVSSSPRLKQVELLCVRRELVSWCSFLSELWMTSQLADENSQRPSIHERVKEYFQQSGREHQAFLERILPTRDHGAAAGNATSLPSSPVKSVGVDFSSAERDALRRDLEKTQEQRQTIIKTHEEKVRDVQASLCALRACTARLEEQVKVPTNAPEATHHHVPPCEVASLLTQLHALTSTYGKNQDLDPCPLDLQPSASWAVEASSSHVGIGDSSSHVEDVELLDLEHFDSISFVTAGEMSPFSTWVDRPRSSEPARNVLDEFAFQHDVYRKQLRELETREAELQGRILEVRQRMHEVTEAGKQEQVRHKQQLDKIRSKMDHLYKQSQQSTQYIAKKREALRDVDLVTRTHIESLDQEAEGFHATIQSFVQSVQEHIAQCTPYLYEQSHQREVGENTIPSTSLSVAHILCPPTMPCGINVEMLEQDLVTQHHSIRRTIEASQVYLESKKVQLHAALKNLAHVRRELSNMQHPSSRGVQRDSAQVGVVMEATSPRRETLLQENQSPGKETPRTRKLPLAQRRQQEAVITTSGTRNSSNTSQHGGAVPKGHGIALTPTKKSAPLSPRPREMRF